MKSLYSRIILFFITIIFIYGCNKYDDSLLRENINKIEQELSDAEGKINTMEEQMNFLTSIINSEFVSYLNITEDGKCILTYIKGGKKNTVELALESDVIKVPIVNAKEFEDGNLYWVQTSDNGKTYDWILDAEGNKMPVGGIMPDVTIDEEGFWCVNGIRFTDKDGNNVLADDVSNTLFQSVIVDEEGFAVFTLVGGTSFKVQIYEALNIEFDDIATIVAIPDRNTPAVVHYTLSGTKADDAFVDYFTAYNVDVEIDEVTSTISIRLHESAEEGNVVIMASAGDNTVIKPIFVTYGTAEISKPEWDAEFGSQPEINIPGEITEFDLRVSANIDYDVTISEECSDWLTFAPVSRASFITKTHSFVASYYENLNGVERVGNIIFSNKAYGVTVNLEVRQSPAIPEEPTEPGISSAAELVAFAKAVNLGADISRWQNEKGEVVLLEDIDITGLEEWTPIGSGLATGTPAYSLATPFTGVFNGQGHTIKGVNWTFNVESENTHLWGLFGALKDAEIKNLILGEEGDIINIIGSTSNVVAIGAIAGYAEDAKFTNVRNNVNLNFAGDNPSATLMMIGGITGCVKSTVIGGDSKDYGVVNAGYVKTGKITNTASGGTGMNIGGICAFTLGNGTILNYCKNYGEISAPTGRGGGLVGTIGGDTKEENSTVVSNSENYGLIQDDIVGQFGGSKDAYNNKRMGGLVGGTVNNVNIRIEYCTNYGNVFSQIGCRAGGFAGHNNGKIVGCVNKGIILSNITYSEGAPQHGPGWACGYSSKGVITQCAKGGKVGEWDTFKNNPNAAPDATDDNALCYKNSEYYDPSQNL